MRRGPVNGNQLGLVRCLQGCHLHGSPLYVVEGGGYCHDCAAKLVMKKARAAFRAEHGALPIWDELAFAAVAIKEAGFNPDIVFQGQARSVREKVAEIFGRISQA